MVHLKRSPPSIGGFIDFLIGSVVKTFEQPSVDFMRLFCSFWGNILTESLLWLAIKIVLPKFHLVFKSKNTHHLQLPDNNAINIDYQVMKPNDHREQLTNLIILCIYSWQKCLSTGQWRV